MSTSGNPGEGPPPQQIFALNLVSICDEEALLTTMNGQEARISLDFTEENSMWKRISEVQPAVHQGMEITVKELGKLATWKLGFDPVTPLHISTRISQNNRVLPMHQPIATLLENRSLPFVEANKYCHYCKASLCRVPHDPATFGPFDQCLFCGDKPSWHHGACCPHNPVSIYNRGPTHVERYHVHWQRSTRNRDHLQ